MKCNKCGSDNLNTSNYCALCGLPLLGGADAQAQATRNVRFPLYDPLNFKPGEIFADRYRIVGEIGRGGMGRVYRALDQELGIEIAIKVIRPEFLDDERMVKRFKNEILLAREISHEHVVRIHDFSEWQGIKYITMQFVDGITLREHLTSQGALGINEAVELALQICQGLDAARKKEIAHRDLKPQNILLDKNNHSYIADFGLAKSMNSSSASLSGVIIGTPEYIAPEQWRGGRGDFRSDIYSLGIIMYEMLTARPLFSAETELGYLQKHLNETPVFSAQERQRIPDYLRQIIFRCLAKEPDARYQTALEVEEDLKTQQASTAPLHFKLRRWLRKGRVPAALIIVSLVLIWGFFMARKGIDPFGGDLKRKLAIMPFVNNTGEARFSFWSSALADLISTDLGQSRHFQLVSLQLMQDFLGEHVDWNAHQRLTKAQLEALRKQTGAEFVLLGELSRAGQRFRIAAQLLAVQTGELGDSFYSDGLGEESFFSMIDSLTDKAKLAFKLPREVILQDMDKDIRQISTRSIEALKAYSTAKELYHLNKRKEALVEYEKAIAADGDFAMAYANAALLMDDQKDLRAESFFQQALARLDHVSAREKFLIQGRYQNSIKQDRLKALAIYQDLLKEYPDDEEAWEVVASISRNMERWDQSTEAFHKLEQLTPGRGGIYANLNYNELVRGRFISSLEILERYRNDFLRAGIYYRACFYVYFLQGRLDLARAELDKAVANDPKPGNYAEFYGDIFLMQDNLADAEIRYQQLLASGLANDQKMIGLQRLSNLALHRGQFSQAVARLDQMETQGLLGDSPLLIRTYHRFRLQVYLLANHPDMFKTAIALARRNVDMGKIGDYQNDQLTALYYLARLLLKGGDFSPLPGLLDAMNELVTRQGEAFARYPLHISAEMALAQGRLEEAKNFALAAQKLFPNPQNPHGMAGDFLHTLARIEDRLGHTEEAIAQYELIINQNMGRTDAAAAFVMAHVELARLYQRLGLSARSRDMAARVVAWWGGGDLAPAIVAEMKNIVSE